MKLFKTTIIEGNTMYSLNQNGIILIYQASNINTSRPVKVDGEVLTNFLPTAISIEEKDKALLIKGKDYTYQMPISEAIIEIPQVQEKITSVKGLDVDFVSSCIKPQSPRNAYKSIIFHIKGNSLRIIGTDSNQLGLIDISIPETQIDKMFFVPYLVKDYLEDGDMDIFASGSHIRFQFSNYSVISPTYDESLTYQPILDTVPKEEAFKFKAKQMKDILSLMKKAGIYKVSVSANNSSLSLSADKFNASIGISHFKYPFQATLDVEKLYKVLSYFSSVTVLNSSRPVYLREDNKLYIIMPYQTND